MTLTPQDNIMTYSIWVEHRDNYQDISKPYNARTELIKYMKTLMAEKGLKFSKIKQPVQLLHQPESTAQSVNELPSDHNNSSAVQNELRKRHNAGSKSERVHL